MGYRRPVCRSDNLATFMCRNSRNLGPSARWNPRACLGIARPLDVFIKWKQQYVKSAAKVEQNAVPSDCCEVESLCGKMFGYLMCGALSL
jgi:hypothetical protein